MAENLKNHSLEDGWVKHVTLKPPELSDNTSDADRLVEGLKKELKADGVAIDLLLLKKMPFLLREWDYQAGCVVLKDRQGWQVVGLFPLQQPAPPLGLAVDLGTSRVVIRLVSLLSGDVLGEQSFDNPQISIGPDILARVHFSEETKGLDTLNRLIIDGLNQNIDSVCRSCGVDPESIYLISLAGNTTMTHLFMGLDPRWIIREPYIPVINRPGMLRASDLGVVINPSGRIYIHPNIGSYFGGDLMAGILFSGMHTKEETAILVDVGTNAEVVLGNRNWLIACAGAAGPALEGGVTRMGMLAGPGVIDKVAITPGADTFELHTIGNARPKGICGSGLIDLAAHLFLSGMLDIRGKFDPGVCGARLKQDIRHALPGGCSGGSIGNWAGSHCHSGGHRQPDPFQGGHVHHPGNDYRFRGDAAGRTFRLFSWPGRLVRLSIPHQPFPSACCPIFPWTPSGCWATVLWKGPRSCSPALETWTRSTASGTGSPTSS